MKDKKFLEFNSNAKNMRFYNITQYNVTIEMFEIEQSVKKNVFKE